MNADTYRSEVVNVVRIDENIDTLGPFSATMAQKLPHVDILVLKDGRWMSERMHFQIFLQLGIAFQATTNLKLCEVHFPSLAVFGRLISALPRLTNLVCWDLEFSSSSFKPGCIYTRKGLALTRIELQGSGQVVEFLASTSMCNGLRHITFKDYNKTCGPAYQRLVDQAKTSLRSMDIRQSFILGDRNVIPLDLSSVVNLERISLDMSAHELERQSLKRAATLLKVLPAKLREIKITLYSFTLRKWYLEDLLSTFDTLPCTQIDRNLSGPSYTKLTEVTFEFLACIHLADVRRVPAESAWREHLMSIFPRLHDKKLLR
ncbi:uncharacterized protein FIBRA_07543 [Fibroporia radiculosa]|uniref:F-box domain-containing protein n=1 Tax=Fibroporia radiculosa TaxID=599839 RepID=J4H4P1_9APHY|nr:uncharacterized protein FIBRA_07543 [Fibroporia radiculosa]CCM05329.1 predicted protein [Fibroporia radiculosa]